ncbi:23S rRNA (guanosine(2251)-2'-O)-methyltransferase [Synechococcus sp. WH 8101]|uniref:23S rRNA (guanosine(2251)-2'-O)-methyltransferase RlmB n=1 Tax=Synechococcus sp. WH 8101 TaxID=59932 RepID=UPI001022EF1A|nr:23S rRNA (guanosine(2251)-2'-O)-methyltransferase RlmB [Synechococcus sp. WH 8101]QBE69265.1 23S rRNA (guanosine(2251)-2'-O)-methyltransferase [Synechococcus sp. WH 8101]QNI45501.1 23S rRNA (guanosine2251-2'-O)-methyltransferase [Synechococcus sp. WH 8101]
MSFRSDRRSPGGAGRSSRPYRSRRDGAGQGDDRPPSDGRREDRYRRDRADRGRPDRERPDRERSFRERPSRDRFDRGRPERDRPDRFNREEHSPREPRWNQEGRSDRTGRFDRDQRKPMSSRPERSRPDYRRGPQRAGWTPPERAAAPALAPEASSHAAEPPADDLLWGRHATQAALEAGRPIHRIWCTSDMRSAPRFMGLLREAKASGVLVEEVTWARLGQITGGAVHQGIALQTAAAETLDLPTLIEGCASLGEPPLLLALDGLTDPHNLGAIVRSAEALGAHGVVLPQRRSAGLTGSVAKVAAGALEHLPVARVVNLNRSLESLKDAGYRVVGLAEEGDLTLAEADLEGPLVVVTGSEGDGLSLLTRRHCDQLIRIPLRGITPSLNASVATALCLYEVARRGWMKDLRGQAPSPAIRRPRFSNAAQAPNPEAPNPEAPAPESSPAEGLSADVVHLDLNRTEQDNASAPSPAVFDGSIEL